MKYDNYDIRVKNTLRTDVDQPTYTVQEGDQYSKGVELDLVSSPIAGLFLKAGWAYNDSKYTNAAESVNGRRPVNSSAKNAVNWLLPTLLEVSLSKDLGLVLEVILTGKTISSIIPRTDSSIPTNTRF